MVISHSYVSHYQRVDPHLYAKHNWDNSLREPMATLDNMSNFDRNDLARDVFPASVAARAAFFLSLVLSMGLASGV